jgi:hypothetical protein
MKYYIDSYDININDATITFTFFKDEKIKSYFKDHWNKIDFDNMKNKPLFLNRTDLPDMFDMILLDGGEFSTYYEYLQIKDRCKTLVLDDTCVPKCRAIAEELRSQPNKWNIIIDDTTERNGCGPTRAGCCVINIC